MDRSIRKTWMLVAACSMMILPSINTMANEKESGYLLDGHISVPERTMQVEIHRGNPDGFTRPIEVTKEKRYRWNVWNSGQSDQAIHYEFYRLEEDRHCMAWHGNVAPGEEKGGKMVIPGTYILFADGSLRCEGEASLELISTENLPR